jgi:type I restriction enzyme, S subunit
MSWPKKKLESLASNERYSFVGGPFGSKLTSRDYVDYGVPVIRGSNLNNGRYLDMNAFVYVSDSKVREDLSSNLARPLDLVFTQRGTLGQVAIIPDDGVSDRYVVSQSQMKLTVDDAKADSRFIYYYFSSRQVIERITNFTSSSGVPHINLTVLRNFEVPIPPLKTQKRIASILSTYDDLIENNRRRIQLLEQAVRLLYEEWFVHLRFPGHEHVKEVDGVPEGWMVWPIKKVIQGLYDGPHATPPPSDEGPLFLGIKNISESGQLDLSTVRNISENDFHRWTKRVVPRPGDIVFSYEATLNLYALIPDGFRGCLGRRLALIRPNAEERNGLFIFLSFFSKRWRDIIERNKLSGATVDRISLSKFPDFPFLYPPNFLILLFDDQVKPMFEQLHVLIKQNQKLAEARDLILPRLMNEEVPA